MIDMRSLRQRRRKPVAIDRFVQIGGSCPTLCAYRNDIMLTLAHILTGSVGKSTTKELVGAVLAQRFSTLKPEKSYNNEIGLPLTVLRLKDEDQKAVLEIGGGYELGEITRMCRMFPPSIAIVTMVGPV